MIFIGKNYEGDTIAIVNAKTWELANAFWQGRNVIPHSVKCLEVDYTNLNDHPTGVFPILETEELELVDRGFGSSHAKTYVVVKR